MMYTWDNFNFVILTKNIQNKRFFKKRYCEGVPKAIGTTAAGLDN